MEAPNVAQIMIFIFLIQVSKKNQKNKKKPNKLNKPKKPRKNVCSIFFLGKIDALREAPFDEAKNLIRSNSKLMKEILFGCHMGGNDALGKNIFFSFSGFEIPDKSSSVKILFFQAKVFFHVLPLFSIAPTRTLMLTDALCFPRPHSHAPFFPKKTL